MTRLGRLHLNSAGLCAIRMKALIDYWQIDELLLGECRHTAGTAAHALLEVTNISFSTSTNNDRTVLMRTYGADNQKKALVR